MTFVYFDAYEERKLRRNILTSTASISSLEKFSLKGSHAIKRAIADYGHTPGYILDNMKASDGPGLSRSIARHKNCSLETLKFLVENYKQNLDLLDTVAANPNADEDLLISLVNLGDSYVHLNIIKNANVSEEVLTLLTVEGKERSVRKDAKLQLQMRKEMRTPVEPSSITSEDALHPV